MHRPPNQRVQGHRFQSVPNNEIQNKITYNQLLAINSDLSRDNSLLKDLAKRLGQQLRELHRQFEPAKRQGQQKERLYTDIRAHPILKPFEAALIPLFVAYQQKIQKFQHDFQTVHDQFFTVQKKFQQVCKQNETLKGQLTKVKKQLIEVYQNAGSQKMHSDFGRIIIDQINQKQKILVQLNNRLESDFQKYKSQSQHNSSQLESTKKKYEQCKTKLTQFQNLNKQFKIQNHQLKQKSSDNQTKLKQLQSQKNKAYQDNQRSTSQNTHLTKQKQLYKTLLDQFKEKIQKDTNIPSENDQNKQIEQLKTKIQFLEASQKPDDSYKKLQKDYDVLLKQKFKYKQSADQWKILEDSLNTTINQLKQQSVKLKQQRDELKKKQNHYHKLKQTLTENTKKQINNLKNQQKEENEKKQLQTKQILQAKEKQINELKQSLDHAKLQKDRIQKQYSLYSKEPKSQKPSKEAQRALNKMRQQMTCRQDFFKQQKQIHQNSLAQLHRLKKQLEYRESEKDQLQKRYQQVCKKNKNLQQQFRKIQNEAQENLRQKQQAFNQKIQQIKQLVQSSQQKRKKENENTQKIVGDKAKAVQQMRNLYEQRIRQLENQLREVQYMRPEVTSGR